jgi:hypothetical protein
LKNKKIARGVFKKSCNKFYFSDNESLKVLKISKKKVQEINLTFDEKTKTKSISLLSLSPSDNFLVAAVAKKIHIIDTSNDE